ncbi:MAG TPA: hypothetical protein VIF60_16250 [Burkholderiaceae bacterium]|jgi:hypothetical protein
MDMIKYVQHEPWYDPVEVDAPLWAFFYDIPYLSSSGVFPPLHILNQRLRFGGGDGGMSPGASWLPFQVSEEQYAGILPYILNAALAGFPKHVRYTLVIFIQDATFDHILDSREWGRAVSDKHRAAFFRRQEQASLRRAGQINH